MRQVIEGMLVVAIPVWTFCIILITLELVL